MLFSVFMTYQFQVGRVLTCKQKNLIGELKLETPKTKYFSPFSFIQSAARRFENKNKIIRRFKNFFVFFFCLVRCRYCRLKKNIDFKSCALYILNEQDEKTLTFKVAPSFLESFLYKRKLVGWWFIISWTILYQSSSKVEFIFSSFLDYDWLWNVSLIKKITITSTTSQPQVILKYQRTCSLPQDPNHLFAYQLSIDVMIAPLLDITSWAFPWKKKWQVFYNVLKTLSWIT